MENVKLKVLKALPENYHLHHIYFRAHYINHKLFNHSF